MRKNTGRGPAICMQSTVAAGGRRLRCRNRPAAALPTCTTVRTGEQSACTSCSSGRVPSRTTAGESQNMRGPQALTAGQPRGGMQ